jgi:hypothetical protein
LNTALDAISQNQRSVILVTLCIFKPNGVCHMNKHYAMKSIGILPIALGLLLASSVTLSSAQSATEATTAPLTRAQVKMERDDFLKSHTYDSATETWMVKKGFEAPAGMKTRAEIKAERDEFLRNNRYDSATETWIPLKNQPRDMSGLTREQVREETRQFVRTHAWDDVKGAWVDRSPAKKKK